MLSLLAAFALAGVPLSWVRHFRIAVTANGISEGLSGLPRALLPYLGINQWIRTVMVLGAGVLLLDAALIVALAPHELSDGRRAAAATALIALAVVPSTLVRPELPYLQGLILFLLVAAFMWGDRIRQGDLVTASLLALLAGAAAMLAAPRLDTHKPWLNYQALASNLAPAHPESFDWTQRYGPLHWPQHGKEVLEIQARHPDYWKAEDLDVFDGRGWVAQSVQAPDAQGTIAPANLQQWTQTLHVTIRGMNTTNIIAAGVAASPTHVTSLVAGLSEGTWVDPTGLGPGDSYDVSAYDPHPAPSQLAAAGTNYPGALLPSYLSLVIPSNPGFVNQQGALPVVPSYQQVFFAPFGSRLAVAYSPSTPNPAVALAASPYARAYALARAAGPARRDAVRVRDERQALPRLGRVRLRPECGPKPLSARDVSVRHQARLLPAVRRLDGAAAADGRRPGPGGCRVRDGPVQQRDQELRRCRHRRPRVGGGVVPELRLGPV